MGIRIGVYFVSLLLANTMDSTPHAIDQTLVPMLKKAEKKHFKKKAQKNKTWEMYFLRQYGQDEWDMLEDIAQSVESTPITSDLKKLLCYLAQKQFEGGHTTFWKLRKFSTYNKVHIDMVASNVEQNEGKTLLRLRMVDAVQVLDSPQKIFGSIATTVLQSKYGFSVVPPLVKDGELMPTYNVMGREVQMRFFYVLLKLGFKWSYDFDATQLRHLQRLSFIGIGITASFKEKKDADYRSLYNKYQSKGENFKRAWEWVIEYLKDMAAKRKKSIKQATDNAGEVIIGKRLLEQLGFSFVSTNAKSPIKSLDAKVLLEKLRSAQEEERDDAMIEAAVTVAVEQTTNVVVATQKKDLKVVEAATNTIENQYIMLNARLGILELKNRELQSALDECIAAYRNNDDDEDDRPLPPIPEPTPEPSAQLSPQKVEQSIAALKSVEKNASNRILNASKKVASAVKGMASETNLTFENRDSLDVDELTRILKVQYPTVDFKLCGQCAFPAKRICECNAMYYCSDVCSKKHWIEHQFTCDAYLCNNNNNC